MSTHDDDFDNISLGDFEDPEHMWDPLDEMDLPHSVRVDPTREDITTTLVWTTAEGEHIPFSELSDSHLSNIIALLERRAPVYVEARLEYLRVLDMIFDNEDANCVLGDEITYLEDWIDSGSDPADLWPSYSVLLAEREKRRSAPRPTQRYDLVRLPHSP